MISNRLLARCLATIAACAAGVGLAACANSTSTPPHLPVATPRLSSGQNGPPVNVDTSQPVSGQTFVVTTPAGWKTARATLSGGVTAFFLTSKPTMLPTNGIPPKGVIALTVVETPGSGAPALASPSPTSGGSFEALVGLASKLVGTPQSATEVKSVTGVKSIQLAGVPAIEYASSYMYNGAKNIQEDVVGQSGQFSYLVELDVAPELQTEGEAVLNELLKGWTWRGEV